MVDHAELGGRPRLLIFIVAFNAERTLEGVLNRIPAALAGDYEVEVLVIHDASGDRTFDCGRDVRRDQALGFPLHVLINPVNQGYGGNQKIGFHFALKEDFDFVALLHGDGQYAPECLPAMVRPLAEGEADAVLGSRMMTRRSARRGGMPLYKFLGNKTVTSMQNRLLRANLSEFHSGYRVYSTEALRRIPFDLNTNDFHFDTEIIIQLMIAGLRIKELPIPTYYGDEMKCKQFVRFVSTGDEELAGEIGADPGTQRCAPEPGNLDHDPGRCLRQPLPQPSPEANHRVIVGPAIVEPPPRTGSKDGEGRRSLSRGSVRKRACVSASLFSSLLFPPRLPPVRLVGSQRKFSRRRDRLCVPLVGPRRPRLPDR